MTPAARIAAAIDILDAVLAGQPAEAALINWGRASRFAGSKDRAAVRDHVYDGLRRRRSASALGGAETGRGIMLGVLRAQGADIETIFTGQGHAPAVLSPADTGRDPLGAEAVDWPEWLWPHLVAGWGEDAAAIAAAQQDRAPVFVRVNIARTTREAVVASLADEGIAAVPHPVATALKITDNARKLQTSIAYDAGWIEMQDASSQAAIAALDVTKGQTVLDYCAGGGGKSLALAALGARVTAHDADPRRMKDIEPRAQRAKTRIEILSKVPGGRLFDLVFCDAPCSGSGTWRRTPDAKWKFDAKRLSDLTAIQGQILDDVVGSVAIGGRLAYATCSVLSQENQQVVEGFVARHSGWSVVKTLSLRPGEDGDGFYLAILEHNP